MKWPTQPNQKLPEQNLTSSFGQTKSQVANDPISVVSAHRPSMAITVTPLIVSVAEAAAILSVSRDHVYRLIESRELPVVQMAIGRSLTRIRMSALEALVDSRSFS